MNLKNIVGHEKQINFLCNLDYDSLYHSWIFYGKKGIGKYSTIVSFLKDKLVNKTNYTENIFNLTCNLETSIDDVREIIKFANLTNATNKEKLFIVFDNADYLNFQSWNALLKTIEEPPSNTIIILILENIKRIPKTIISRCHLLKFNHLTNKNLEDYCIKKRIKIDINFLKTNEFLIRGSINRLNIIFEDENKLIINNAMKFMDGHYFIFEEFEKLYDLITKDNHKLKFLLIDLIYYKLKEIFINSDLDKSIRKSSLELLNFIKENFDIISIKDQKQEFLVIFMEYFRLKKK